ncbi:hypothetical protein BJX70DRAFT_368777 [Aspergillus crustosus]
MARVLCPRGLLERLEAFSAVGMVVQSLLHWLAAMALLGVFLYFRHGRSNSMAEYSPLVQDGDHVSIGTALGPDTPLLEGLISGDGQAVLSSSAATAMYGSNSNTASAGTTTTPSSRVLLALVITHAVLLIPPAIYIMLKKIPSDNDLLVFLAAQAWYIVLAITGFLTSLTAMIPQIHLIIARSRSGLQGPGNLSLLGTGLQSLALFALSASQWSRFGSYDPTSGGAAGPVQYFWAWFRGVGASPVGYLVLALGQLVVFCVALGVGGRGALHW